MILGDVPTNFTDLAVSVGRIEEKLNHASANRENDIAFQQSARDTFAAQGKDIVSLDKRLVAIESGFRLMKWATPILVTIGVFLANWISALILK